MPHIRIRFTKGHEGGVEVKGWHLLSQVGDGEYTACGLAEPEYETKRELKDKGGITCPNCLETIKYYKSIKL